MQTAVAVIGGIAGFAIGGPAGARWGFAIGGMIGGYLYPPGGGADVPQLAGVRFTSAQKGQVLPVIYGRVRLPGSVIWMGDYQEHDEGGKKEPSVTTYSATLAVALCEGQASQFLRIWVGDDERDIADVPHTIHLGTPDQIPDAYMASVLEDDQPNLNYPYVCYVVLNNWNLGYSMSIPNLSFEMERLTFDINLHNPAMAALGLNGFAEDANGDMNPVYCLADFLTDTRYGLGIPVADILGASFITEATWAQGEGLYCSPVLDVSQNAIHHIEHLLSYFDGILIYSQGLFKLRARHNPAYEAVDYQPVDWTEWVEQPIWSRAISRQTPNQLALEYRLRENDYNKSIAIKQDDWDIGRRGPYREQISLPGVTTEVVADILSSKYMWSKVIAPFMVEVRLGPQALYYEPGDLVSLVGSGAYAMENSRIRIVNIREEKNGEFTITAIEER